MICEADVLAHHAEVMRHDTELIEADPTHARGEVIRRPIDDYLLERYIDCTSPRPSLALLKMTYRWLHDTSQELRETAPGLLEEVILPMTGIISPSEGYDAILTDDIASVCLKAEEVYPWVIDHVRDQTARSLPRVSVYHTADGIPLALRGKNAILLETARFGDLGMHAVSGTLIAVNHDMNQQQTGNRVDGKYKYATYQVDGPFAMNPMRLSAWAYDDPKDRALFGLHPDYRGGFSYEARRGELVTGTAIDDFREAAHQVMAMCGVE